GLVAGHPYRGCAHRHRGDWRDRRLHRAQAARSAHQPGQRRQPPPRRRRRRCGVPRLDRTRCAGRWSQAGTHPRRQPADRVHPRASAQGLSHHRAHQGLRHPRLGRRRGREDADL
ncbi:MAG: Anti-sigma factor antagonist BldG, partial [uncultured Nocardioidaceae bacterium]